MTVINDTRVVRLLRTAARIGHQHSADQPIVETVTRELVTVADIVSLPPGSLITLQRGPGAGLTEEGSVLNASGNDIGGVEGGQTTSVSFNSEDGDVTANAIFANEIDFALSLSTPGQYAINYKTFQIKTYTAVPTTPGQRIEISYTWANIREYLEWVPEDLNPDLVAFGVGPHAHGGDGYDGYVIVSNNDVLAGTLVEKIAAGHGISLSIDNAGDYEVLRISSDLRLDGYASDQTVSEHYIQHSEAIQAIIQSLDGYANHISAKHIRKLGSEADNYPFNSVFSLDGYTYTLGDDRLLVYINGIAQFPVFDYVERNQSSVELVDPADIDDVVDIVILPGSLGGVVDSSLITLQNSYDGSPSESKNIIASDGQITITQTQSSGAALRLISNASVTPTLIIDQGGSGEALRLKSVDSSVATLLLQKDTTARNSVINTLITERTTSHVLGGQTGIGSAILTRLESSGTSLFNASRIVTGTESATDSAEKTYLSVEVSDDGILTEHLRLTSNGHLGIRTSNPQDFTVQVAGDVGPDEDNLYDLGSNANRWKDGYFGPGSIHVGTGRFSVDDTTGDPRFYHENGTSYNLLWDKFVSRFVIDPDSEQIIVEEDENGTWQVVLADEDEIF